jgi:hypothetical protein
VYRTQTFKAGIATLALGLVFAGTAQASQTTALKARSEALNRQYAPLRAIALRSEALNQKYGLGDSATGGTPSQALRAIQVRSDALNQQYKLGTYAVVRVGNGFDWADAGIGAAGMLGIVLVGGGIAIAVRKVSVPSTT